MEFDGFMSNADVVVETDQLTKRYGDFTALDSLSIDQGSTVHLHRMLVPFPKSATWSSLVAGVSADGVEASRHKDSLTFGKIAANTSTVHFDVTDTVQRWSSGKPNYGWVFINTGGNGWDFYTCDHDDIKQRPRLVVEYAVQTQPSGISRDLVR